MNRRQFLTIFKGAPLIAAPSLALSAVAMSESKKASDRINDIALNGNQNIIQDCTFTMGGNIQLTGDYQMVQSCNFEMTGKRGVCMEVKGQNSTYTGVNMQGFDTGVKFT